MINDFADLEPGIGHNRPVGWLALDDKGRVTLDAAAMREYLLAEIETLADRRDELLGSVARCPIEITDDDTARRVADLIKLIMACVKNAEADRVARKEPFLEGGRLIDGTFKAITEPLDRSKRIVEGRLTTYQREVAAAERRRREAEEQAKREEAAKLAREAAVALAEMRTEDDLAAAILAERAAGEAAADAEVAARAADANAAEMSRQRSDLGAVASLRTFWDFADLDRGAIDLEALRPHLALDAIEKAVRSFIRAGGRELRGCRIYENTTSQVR
jgi:hypothetical protein